MKPLTFGSLFAGIGGFDCGLDRAGMSCAFQVEKDPHCLSVLAKHWPDVPRFNDVSEFHGTSLAVRPDWIVGGFPCQDLSVAGKRAGLAGKRSGLFHEFMRIVSEFTPAGVLIENVPGLLSSNGGRDMGIVVGALADLGYGWCYRVLDAQYFGVAQRRRRVFIVGHLGGVRRAAEILFESESLPWHPAPRREARTGITPILAAGAGGSNGLGCGRDGAPMMTLDSTGAQAIAATLNSGGNNGGFRTEPGEHLVAHALTACRTASGRMDPNGETFIAEPMTFDPRNVTSAANRTRVEPGLPCGTLHEMPQCVAHTLRAEGCDASEDGTGRGTPLAVVPYTVHSANSCAKERHAFETHTAKSLDTTGGFASGQGGTVGVVASGVRRLTPVECCRLQGFPDDWLNGLGLSDSAKYRMLGNAVCVNVAEWIGRRIIAGGSKREHF